MSTAYKSLEKKLKDNGWRKIRQGKGSHQVWAKGQKKLIVPYNTDKKYTIKGIMKEAGIKA